MQIRPVIKKLFKVLKWAMLLAVIYAAGMVAINAHDEAPDPGIAAFTTNAAPAVPDAGNAFFTLLAFDAPTDMDAHAEGMAMVARHEGIFKQDPYTLTYPSEQWENSVFSQVTAMIGDKHLNNLVCGYDGVCGRWRTADIADLQAQIDKYSAQLARYEGLYGYSGFRETETPSPRRVAADKLGFTPRQLHQVELAKVALALRGGQMADALGLLARDAAFWRMVLRDTELEETRNDAVRRVTEDVQLLSDILSTETLDARSLQAAQAILTPLSPQALGCQAILRHKFLVHRQLVRMYLYGQEFRILRPFTMRYVRYLQRDPKGSWGERMDDAYYKTFFKENATINRLYRQYAAAEKITELPPGEFLSYLSKHLGRRPFVDGMDHAWRDHFYNPAGAGQAYLSAYDTACRARPIDLDGYIRLVTLQLEAKQQNVTAETMAAFLRNASSTLFDPYTGAPMTYDADSHQLYFMGLDINSYQPTRRVSVPL